MTTTTRPAPALSTRVEHALDARSVPVAAWLYRRTRGRIARLSRRDVLVLTATGRRSGRPRTVVLQYFHDGDDLVLVAANGGMPTHPAWYLNLMADPIAVVEVGDRRFAAEATPLDEAEARAFWPRVLDAAPDYARFPERTDRTIPLVRLHPRPDLPSGEPKLPGTPPRWANSAMRILLSTPGLRAWLGRGFGFISVTGARTGTVYSTPVQHLAVGGHRVVLSQTGRRWWRNLRTRPEVELRFAGKVLTGRATVLEGSDGRELLARCLTQEPRIARFYGLRPGRTGVVPAADLDRLLERVVVIDLVPDP